MSHKLINNTNVILSYYNEYDKITLIYCCDVIKHTLPHFPIADI